MNIHTNAPSGGFVSVIASLRFPASVIQHQPRWFTTTQRIDNIDCMQDWLPDIADVFGCRVGLQRQILLLRDRDRHVCAYRLQHVFRQLWVAACSMYSIQDIVDINELNTIITKKTRRDIFYSWVHGLNTICVSSCSKTETALFICAPYQCVSFSIF